VTECLQTGRARRGAAFIERDLTLLAELGIVDALVLIRQTLPPCYVHPAVTVHGERNGLFDVGLTEQQTATPVPIWLVGALECTAAASTEEGERGGKEEEQDVTETEFGVHVYSACVSKRISFERGQGQLGLPREGSLQARL
jgi:hypothetical protein